MEKRDLYNIEKINTRKTIFKEERPPENFYTLVVSINKKFQK